MPLTIPTLDDRRYQDLLDEALARIPIHTPEWTNFNQSDPGVTLIQMFAFLTENLLYRSNQIPERNRRKFLSLLGIPLKPASSARGLVTFDNERGPLQTITLQKEVEVRAGQIPFRTASALDILPIEAQVFYKDPIEIPTQELRDYYAQLYASFRGDVFAADAELRVYETRPLSTQATGGVDLSKTMDRSLWVALLIRANDKPYERTIDEVRAAIAGKTINLGLVPYFDTPERTLQPGTATVEAQNLLEYKLPKIPPSGGLPSTGQRLPDYQTVATSEIPIDPVVVQITLPAAEQLKLWNNFEPLESGAEDFPPNLEDTTFSDRIVTWLRIVVSRSGQLKVKWVGINAVFVDQKAHVANELLPAGSGEPDQAVTLSKTPVIPGSVQLSVTLPTGVEERWQEIDDLLAAGPEVPTPDLRLSPSIAPLNNNIINVFELDRESGVMRAGDGILHGRRWPRSAILRASYDFSVGRAGNVGPQAINNGPALPAGIKVSNPVRTWGGAEAETVGEGEKQITRYLQHRDRLVTSSDFETIARRTPGVDMGRVDVLPAYNPRLSASEPGDAPGAVTLMLIPRYDELHPDTPEPTQDFINAVCEYLNPRRLVTTELFLRPPTYKPIWISIGFKAVAGARVVEVREQIRKEIYDFLSPLPAERPDHDGGWPLLKPVVDRELMAVASRVRDVLLITDVVIALNDQPPANEISMRGLELPRIAGLSVSLGDPISIDQLRGQTSTPSGDRKIVPVPAIPEECS